MVGGNLRAHYLLYQTLSLISGNLFVQIYSKHNYPASHDVPYDMVWSIGLDSIGVGMRDGHTVTSVHYGRSTMAEKSNT